MDHNDLKRVIEALIFAADAPLVPERIRETLEACSDEEIAQVVEALNGEYEAAGHAFMIRAVAGGYQVTTRPQFSNWIKKLYLGRQKGRLSQAALESLAIIAFKQPISRVDIAQIRGVNSDGVIGTLLERKLITISGRSEGVGRPLLYSTTPEFLEFFGINDLTELPKPREIEELIGKEGMSEEVLQALSSDKQLKLPISFDPEAEASETAQLESGIATLSPEQIVEAVSLKTQEAAAHAAAADGISVRNDDALLPLPAQEAAPVSEFENELAASLHDPIERPNADESSPLEHAVENAADSAGTYEKTQRAAAEEVLVSQDELGAHELQTETRDEAVNAEPPPSEISPALPLSGSKKRKRGKHGATDDGQRNDGREPTLVPMQETLLPEIAENRSPNAASEETSQEELSRDDPEAKSAAEFSAAPLEESEVDRVAIVEEELNEGAEEPFLATVPEAIIVPAHEEAEVLQAAPVHAENVLPEETKPQVVAIDENLSVQIIEAPARAGAIVTESELDALAYAERDELFANPSEAFFEDEPAAPTTESSLRSAAEVFVVQPESDEHVALTETVLDDSTRDDAENFVVAAKDSEAVELEAWPEVTEVRVDEPRSVAEEFAPIALAEIRDELQADTPHAASQFAAEEDFADRDEPRENAHHLAPAIIETDAMSISAATNGEQPHAAQRHETDSSSDEEHVFFV